MSKINVSVIGNTAYIFNAEDYMKIRKQYRIVGNLIGFNGQRPRNPNLKGLPAVFSTYELHLLLEKQAIALVDKQLSLTEKPSIEIKKNFLSFQKHNFTEQHEYLRQKKIQESKKVLDKFFAAKQKESNEKLKSDSVIKDIEDTVQIVPLANVLVQIPMQHIIPLSNDHYPETFLPTNEERSFHYRVFRDLWERGKFITNAESFGGDFLVYPNEPLYFHASHIVHVIENGVISPTFMIERARLSVMVNKFCVFAYIGPNNDIAYQTIDWDGNYESAVAW